MHRSLFLLTFILFLQGYTLAQNRLLGNEWICYKQSYFKILVAQNNLYRITTATLQKAGIPFDTIDPTTIQLFHRGVEQAIYVAGEADKRFDTDDFIEFYGRGNDGSQDSLLYRPVNAQPHTYYSLFNDTTAYFLTWRLDGKPGKRMVTYADADVLNLSPEAYHWAEEIRVFSDTYPGWAAGIPPKIEYSYFEAGEGYTGSVQQKGKLYDNVFVLRNAFRTGPAPQVALLVVGRDYGSHRVECHAGPTAESRRLIDSLRFQFYNNAYTEQNLRWSDVGTNGRLLISTVSRDNTSALDAYSISFIKLRYPQRFTGNSVSSRVYQLTPNAAGRSLIRFDSVSAGTRFWDITDPTTPLLAGSVPGPNGSVQLVVRNTQTQRTLFSTSQPQAVLEMTPVTFTDWSKRKPTYLIISHGNLMKPAAGYPNAIQAYAAYRASPAGGLNDTLTAEIGQLFDQFSYGERHPLAIRRFADQMLRQRKAIIDRPLYLLLIGRSRSTPGVRHDPNQAVIDLVPTAGFPGSDMLFTAGLDGQPLDVPALPTGRINAVTPQQVIDYLNKVKEFESVPTIRLWRKKLLHLSGGHTPNEIALFQALLGNYGQSASAGSLGAQVTALTKSTYKATEPVSIARQVNEGVGIVTFFGHSSLDATDLDIGFCSNDALGYRNKGKYPFMLINGCATGNIFYSRPTLSSDWVLTPDRGAIAALANSHLGYTHVLDRYSSHFYEILADSTQLGKSIGQLQQETIRRTLAQNPGGWDLANAQQMVLQGDPAIRLFPMDTPDYAFVESEVLIRGIDNQPLTPFSDSVRVTIVIDNYGQFRNERLSFRIRRIVNGQESGVYDVWLPRAVAFRDTFTLSIPSIRGATGQNQFVLTLNPTGSIREHNRENNSTLAEVIIQESALTDFTIYPNPFRDQVTFTFQLTGEKAPDTIELTITDLNGREVRRLKSGQGLACTIGQNEWVWDGRTDGGDALPSGLYLYRLMIRENGQEWPATADATKKRRGRLILVR
ncbi:C25 family cysteine peptidase [Spirosoma oryzicola]|uniref:putative type IX secretion system sortase PorU2 n=1 Tax=Spirosoma oryzicola TaxID=2898794 RepID=UPI001E5E184F|nr:C25 family cysteine peptidase [Spirosoma oryzicola]UHG92454.1 C25 family cysteine peptidase [Spirosoma oryzicola]